MHHSAGVELHHQGSGGGLVGQVGYFGYDKKAYTVEQIINAVGRQLLGEAHFYRELMPFPLPIRQRKLVAPFNQSVVSPRSYHVLQSQASRHKPEVREFVRELEQDIAQNHPSVELCGMVPGRFAAVVSLRGQELPVSLHHLFRRCTAFPERFSESVSQFLRELEQDGLDQPADHSFAEAAEHLLPQIWGSVDQDKSLLTRRISPAHTS